MATDDVKIQILSEHYKDTGDVLKESIKQRDKYFSYLVCLIVVLLFELYTPSKSIIIIQQIILNKLSITETIGFDFIGSLIWFLLLSVSMRYFQFVIGIERQYSYIHNLEKQLSVEFKEKAFTREGSAYLSNYPIFLNWASFLYTMFFPALLVFIVLMKFIQEMRLFVATNVFCWIDISMIFATIISTVLYVFVLHIKKQ